VIGTGACLGNYYSWQTEVRIPSPSATSSAALLDQLPDVGITVRGRAAARTEGPPAADRAEQTAPPLADWPLTKLLQPAYDSLGCKGQAERT
jgi:hypothetical protein